MISFLKIAVTVFEAAGESFVRRKARTPEELKRQLVQRRNERAMIIFIVFGLALCLVLLVLMALR